LLIRKSNSFTLVIMGVIIQGLDHLCIELTNLTAGHDLRLPGAYQTSCAASVSNPHFGPP
jgi:hypothetical protein